MVKASPREAVEYRILAWYLSTQINLGVFLPSKEEKGKTVAIGQVKKAIT